MPDYPGQAVVVSACPRMERRLADVFAKDSLDWDSGEFEDLHFLTVDYWYLGQSSGRFSSRVPDCRADQYFWSFKKPSPGCNGVGALPPVVGIVRSGHDQDNHTVFRSLIALLMYLIQNIKKARVVNCQVYFRQEKESGKKTCE